MTTVRWKTSKHSSLCVPLGASLNNAKRVCRVNLMKRSWIQRTRWQRKDKKRPVQLLSNVKPRQPMKDHPYHSIKTRAGLKAELHRVTSLIVRLRDGCCVICGSTSDLQAGHFYKRGYLEIAFDLRNVNGQCGFHNKLHNTNPMPYMAYMQKTYGPDVVLELHELRMKKRHIPDSELRDLLESHRALLRTMERAA